MKDPRSHNAAPASEATPQALGRTPRERCPGAEDPPRDASAAPASEAIGTVKCVVWDIDNTLLTGVYLESEQDPPGADPVMADVLAELQRRGILQALASKNPPEAANHATLVTGCDFAAVECGWGAKSASLTRIAEELGIGTDALAFVDDDPYERAEVAAVLPEVLVLSPEDAAEAARWPEFSPPVLTEEGRHRAEMYAARRRRLAAERGFGGSKNEFLRSVGTQVTIAAATGGDAARLDELAVRTRQFNSAAQTMDGPGFAGLIAAGEVVTVRLRDSFGDDGIVGGCVLRRRPASPWSVPLIMMSCRAMGRGVIEALLAWLARAAAAGGATELEIPCQLTDRNVPLRLALASAGFRADGPESPSVFRRDLTGPLPGVPDWVKAREPAAGGW
jgi:methoxymalonate biosynthesis protein